MSSRISRSRPAPEATVAFYAAETVSMQGRHEQIPRAANFLSESRGAAGELPDDLLDWLEAERAIDLHLALPRGHVRRPDQT